MKKMIIKMKNIKIYIASIAFLSLIACKKDYLNVDPIDRYIYYNFPENEGQLETAVVACYRKVYAIYNAHTWIWGDFLSDNTSFRYNPTDRGGVNLEQVEEFVAAADNGSFNGMYQESFEGIGRSNYVLDNIAKITFAAETTKKTREAEARFFRAFHYFNLVRLYGDVPLVKNVITDPIESRKLTRQPVEQIFQEVITPDADFAIATLPKTVTQKGRLTKGAALMFKAKILMTQKKFAEAIPLLEEVKTLGYTLNTAYADNFDPAKKNGNEAILEVQGDPAALYSFGFMGQWAPWGTGVTIWPGGSNSRGGLNQPTDDLDKVYEANDTIRKNTTIGRSGTGAATILYMKKFLYWDAVNKANPCNFPMFRYADALLMLAECQNEVSFPNAQAFINLNLIRKRAGIADKTQGNAKPELAINDQAAFRLAIEKERQVEFAGEGQRWFDLVRTGRADAVMKDHGTREKALKTTVDRSGYNNIRLLLPIPLREIQQFGFKQNPGW
jgi:starch-binding outer membrane protein, SusD/RagB family